MGRKAKKRNITDKLLIKISDDMKEKDLTLIQYAVNVLDCDCTPQTLTNWFHRRPAVRSVHIIIARYHRITLIP